MKIDEFTLSTLSVGLDMGDIKFYGRIVSGTNILTLYAKPSEDERKAILEVLNRAATRIVDELNRT